MKTNRGQRQIATSLFPRAFWTFRNLGITVGENSVTTSQLPFSDLVRVTPMILAQLQERAASPLWAAFAGIRIDNLALSVPTRVTGHVGPTTWWCSQCNKFYSGAAARLGIRNGVCPNPNCRQRSIVQFAAVFMCPECHRIEQIDSPTCAECGDSRNIVLRGSGGRHREYRWRCTVHPQFVRELTRTCGQHQNRYPRMVLKSTGGLVYRTERLVDVHYHSDDRTAPTVDGALQFQRARASVTEAIVGRTPIADYRNFYRGQERSLVEPFVDSVTGQFRVFISQLQTDAIIINAAPGHNLDDEITLHSLKHALLNAAPAVTGLVQEEFAAYIDQPNGSLVIYDNVPGGSGGCRLLADRRRQRWLTVARELAECHQLQCEDACRACLFLPSRICKTNNNGLDRHQVLTKI